MIVSSRVPVTETGFLQGKKGFSQFSPKGLFCSGSVISWVTELVLKTRRFCLNVFGRMFG